MKALLRAVWKDDNAQDIAEYALMLAVILVVVVLTVTAIGENAEKIFSTVADKLELKGGGGK